MASPLILQPDETDGIDSFIYALAASTNFGSENYMYIGEANNAVGAYCRGFFKFDLSSIQSSAKLDSGILYLHTCTDGSSYDYATNAPTYYVYPVLRNWIENQITWNVYSTGNNWGTAGCSNTTTDRGSTSIATGTATASQAQNSEVQITFNSGIEAYFGSELNIIVMTGESNDMYPFHSSGSSTASYRPKLSIYYRLEGGHPVAISPFFNFFKNFENPWKKKGGLWQPQNKGLVTI